MKSSLSNTSSLNWNSPIEFLTKSRKPTATTEKLQEAGINSLLDLLWILPLRIHKTPDLQPFREANLNEYFRGQGKVIHVEIRPAFGRRKSKFLLYNGYVIVKDDHSQENIMLRWFNLYPNQKKQLEGLEHLSFLGQVEEYKAQKQLINPQILSSSEIAPYIIEYPTINKIAGYHLKNLFSAIPKLLWEEVPQTIPELGYDDKLSLGKAFQVMHGQLAPSDFSAQIKTEAEERLIYEEFLIDQLKIQTRRKFIKKKSAPSFELSSKKMDSLIKTLPFKLTPDQTKVFNEIREDFTKGHPMMRMLQGDVGCGKTIVAYLSAMIAIDAKFQVALMCPTEALARQHFETFSELNSELKIDLLLGSTKAKEKKVIQENIKTGKTQLLIGTHSLFQDSVEFKNLGFALIDEQHKFGVEQRLKLIAKGEGVHSLIMSATPIPRTLSLAQYGDLDISTIKTMPEGRIAIKTRITEVANYQKYIEFIKTRLKQKEQAYFVFPAIEESEITDLQNVKESFEKYQKQLSPFKVFMLHGKMKPDEKESVVEKFKNKEADVLLSTSVIEVGINIPNATIMSVYNPERFGLSSLHQLRGRVGRGDKPGFCFLVLDKELSPESMKRLEVIEKNLDGFIIAEEDLKMRGEGDIFGVDQSGSTSGHKLANFITHSHILEQVVADLKTLSHEKEAILLPIWEKLAKDQKILDTV